jgi:hypothetical protein
LRYRVIPTKVHGVVDLVTGPALIAAPTAFRLNGTRAAALAPRVFGAAATAYSPLTDYELGVKRVLPLRAHLALDALGGVALAAVPWISGAARKGPRHWLPHAVIGGNEFLLALTTRTERPRAARARTAVASLASRLPRGAVIAGTAAPIAVAGIVAWRRAMRDRAKHPAAWSGEPAETRRPSPETANA